MLTAGAFAFIALLGAGSASPAPRADRRSVEPGAGGELWVKRYNGPANSGDGASALGVSPDGSKVFVAGGSSDFSDYADYATVAYDAGTGARLWVKRYNGPANDDDFVTALAVSPDGSRVFVTGESMGSTSNLDYATVAYDAATGAKLWVKRYNGPANYHDGAFALAVSPDGAKVFVTGGSAAGRTSGDYATVAYDAASGAQLWVGRYNGPANDDDGAQALGVSPDGSKVFVTGHSYGSSGYLDYATVAYDAASGAKLWAKRYSGSVNDAVGDALAVSPDGSKVFVTGESFGPSGSFDYATVAYGAATGSKLWVKRYNGPASSSDAADALGVSSDGSKVFVTGKSEGTGGFFDVDYATVAYDAANGADLWVERYDGPANGFDGALALGVSSDGSEMFVTGKSYGSSGFTDYATVAYDTATGGELWVERYDGPANDDDSADALGVGPDGSKVFVTGSSVGSSSEDDYATVAYETG